MRATLVGLLVALLTPGASLVQEGVPYDRASPVVYDNDGAIESGFTDIYVAALASAGIIDLRGIITTGSYGEERRRPPYSPVSDVDHVRERQELVEKARRSGLRKLPDVTAGPSLSLKRPRSGRIEDTVAYATPEVGLSSTKRQGDPVAAPRRAHGGAGNCRGGRLSARPVNR